MLVRVLLAVFSMILIVSAIAASTSAQECANEGEIKACGSNVGICEAGTQDCRDGKWTECTGGVRSQMEMCDNELDDDCDALVDECIDSIWPVMIMVGILLVFFMFMIMKMGF